MTQNIEKIQQLIPTISLEEEVLKVFVNMPDSLKIEVLHYAEYLLNKVINPSSSHAHEAVENNDIKKTYRKAGSMAGMISMADDFDEPLTELQAYMN